MSLRDEIETMCYMLEGYDLECFDALIQGLNCSSEHCIKTLRKISETANLLKLYLVKDYINSKLSNY